MNRLALIPLVFLAAGCAAHWPEIDPKMESPTEAYRVPPKELLQQVKEIVAAPPLSLGVAEEKDGSILTGYHSFPGEWHVARRWQERTRYRVTISPDWNEPAAAARISVREMTEQRAADGMQWHPAPELQRLDRARELLKKLDAAIKKEMRG